MRLGLVSDTHDLFDPVLETLLAGVDLIVHAGDVVSDRTRVLERLGRVARVVAVRGNNDREGTPARLPDARRVVLGTARIGICHDLKDLEARRAAEQGGVDLLVCEATFLSADARLAADSGHLTARQAGRLAAVAGARRLVLTHFSQRYPDDGAYLEEAKPIFDDVVVARDLMRVPVPRRRAAGSHT